MNKTIVIIISVLVVCISIYTLVLNKDKPIIEKDSVRIKEIEEEISVLNNQIFDKQKICDSFIMGEEVSNEEKTKCEKEVRALEEKVEILDNEKTILKNN